ncbi:MAG: aminotransferase class I/II-fold pyridoxal phosphate-dependent enzyme [Desulfobacteraceae bacterium]|nr:aminotransferase class I/II-fold pyridoxal phosphate-dependent enzyme [Desulfobacteraceae bacterium]
MNKGKLKPESVEKTVFTKEFTRQESIPEEGIERAVELLRSGRLHRYNAGPNEQSDVALLEKEFADYLGMKYCAALSSCGSAIYVALRCAGVKPGDRVLSNAFTLAPVPGAIANAGAEPVFVECAEDYTIDVADLDEKAISSGARYLLLSHMRGHIADMDRISGIADKYGLCLIEDCAHTMGARWGDRNTGTFGKIGCFSAQTYKHMNSGEGGLLVTDDQDIIAQAILYSGSYMLYHTHISRPSLEVFERYKKIIPNFSLRMSNLQAALLRPQLRALDTQVARWNERYYTLENELNTIAHIVVPERHPKEHFVGSSLQFTLNDLTRDQMERFLEECASRGVEIKWFGWKEPKGYTSSFESWQYIPDIPGLAVTKHVLNCMGDFRIPLTFSIEDCKTIATVIREVINEVALSE